jgi:hypothetical protein
VEHVEALRYATEAEGVPERVPPNRGDAPGPARGEADELEARPPAQLAEQPDDVTRGSCAGLDERRGVDPDPHDTALRTASRGSG